MPIHDWTRVRANRFHHFHQTWTANLAAALNSGRLPPGFFALAEQITGGPEADVVALELTPPAGTPSLSAMAVARRPTQRAFRRPFGGRQLRPKGRSDLDSSSRWGRGCRYRDCLTRQQGQPPCHSGLRAKGGRVSPGRNPSADRGPVPAQSPEPPGNPQGDLGPPPRRALRTSAGQAADAGGVRGGIRDRRVYRAGGRRRHPARPTHFSDPRLLCELSPGSDLPGHLERFPGGTQGAAGTTWGSARTSVGRGEYRLLRECLAIRKK